MTASAESEPQSEAGDEGDGLDVRPALVGDVEGSAQSWLESEWQSSMTSMVGSERSCWMSGRLGRLNVEAGFSRMRLRV